MRTRTGYGVPEARITTENGHGATVKEERVGGFRDHLSPRLRASAVSRDLRLRSLGASVPLCVVVEDLKGFQILEQILALIGWQFLAIQVPGV